ncbi:hypothetical protein ACSSV1_004878 [Labrenzia sp. MBR-25]
MSNTDITYDPATLTNARESFSGRLLTDSQFGEAVAITGIIAREIRKSGTFKEKLGDYSYAFARSERFDQMKSETVVRDLFKEIHGQTMNQMREALKAREDTLTNEQKQRAYGYAAHVGTMIKEGEKITFNRAFSHQAGELAKHLDITEAGAKSLMKEAFTLREKKDLYEWGKEIEERHYRPQIEAASHQRTLPLSQSKARNRSR